MDRPTDPLETGATASVLERPAPAPSAGAPKTLDRGVAVGRFVVLEHVATGGMGSLYKAYDPQLDRAVALKVVRSDAAEALPGSSAAERLLREAKVLARLAHPHVVAVFDAGGYGDDVFIAMEFVEGVTLRLWLKTPREVDAVVDVLVAAGEGLAAAHAVGLVHRDFKPDNVLVGDDGRVRVVDFGIARAEGAAEPVAPSAKSSPTAGAGGAPDGEAEVITGRTPPNAGESGAALARSAAVQTPLSAPLTSAGVLLGTPRYMAPEQHIGRGVGPWSDQFAFGVTLFEALYGRSPFAGRSRMEFRERVLAGAVEIPSTETRVPRWLRAVVLRSLSVRPEARFASMAEMLLSLRRGRARQRRRALSLWALAAAAALAVVMAPLALRAQRPLCPDPRERLGGVWDGGRRAAVRAAFAATALPFATAAWTAVEQELDAYAEGWVHGARDACEATRVRAEQSEELFDLRMQCLARRLETLRAQTALFAAADADVVTRAKAAVEGLPPLASCADATSLRATVRMPEGPEARRRIDALRERVAKGRALHAALKFGEGIPLAQAALAEAKAMGFAPARAEAALLVGYLRFDGGMADESIAALHEATLAARAAGDEGLAAEAWLRLAWVTAEGQSQYALAHRWADYAEEAIERSPAASHLRGQLARNRGVIFYREWKLEQALAKAKECHAWSLAHLGPDHLLTAQCLTDVADATADLGHPEEAIGLYERVIADLTRTLGGAHPEVATPTANLGNLLLLQGDAERSLDAHVTARHIREAVLGPRHPSVGLDLANEAGALLALGRAAEAERLCDLSLAIAEERGMGASLITATSESTRAEALAAQGKGPEAVAAAERSIALFARINGEGSPDAVAPLYALGVGRALEGRHREAIDALTRGAALAGKDGGDAFYLARFRLALADSLVASGSPAAEARAMLGRAREAAALAGPRGRRLTEEIVRHEQSVGR